MENQIAVRNPSQDIVPMSIEQMKERAEILIMSGLLPAHLKTPQMVVTVMMYAQEIGFPQMAAVNSFFVLPNGTIGTDTKTMLAMAYRSGQVEDYHFTESEKDNAVTVHVKRKGMLSEVTWTFGDKEATAAGLIGKNTYKAHRRQMYVWRATAAALRVAFPDVLFGLYAQEEFETDSAQATARRASNTVDAEFSVVEDTGVDSWFKLFEAAKKAYGQSADAVFMLLKCKNNPELSTKYETPQAAWDALKEATEADKINARIEPVVRIAEGIFGPKAIKENADAMDMIRNWVINNPDAKPGAFPLDIIEKFVS